MRTCLQTVTESAAYSGLIFRQVFFLATVFPVARAFARSVSPFLRHRYDRAIRFFRHEPCFLDPCQHACQRDHLIFAGQYFSLKSGSCGMSVSYMQDLPSSQLEMSKGLLRK